MVAIETGQRPSSATMEVREHTDRDVAKPPRVNGMRLMDTIHSTCEYGKAHTYGEHYTETGMARLALDDDDKRVRLWLIQQVEALGCVVTIDQMGNIFAIRPGKAKNAAPVMMGSHLDTQPTGGRYDGILGVLAGLEVLRTLYENAYDTNGPVGLVNWTNEEGARFPMITVSSGVWAGSISIEDAWNCLEHSSLCKTERRQTLKQELQRIGFLGSTPASFDSMPIAAHFELHIEQGPILESECSKIGVVTGAQAYRWYEITVRGQDCHAGTTPLYTRRDALLAAAKMIVSSNQVAKDSSGLITIGDLVAKPGSMNTMAHTVRFTLDMRHFRDEKLSEMVDECRKNFNLIARDDCERGVQVEWKCLTENTSVKFDARCIEAIELSAEEACAELPQKTDQKLWRRILSGAGHDSCHVSKVSPTAMIFTPTRNGMSHTPTEYCSPEDCVLGTQVLIGAVLRYDAGRSL